MKDSEFRALIKAVRERVDLAQLVGEKIPLTPSGSVLKGSSPENKDTNPSFVVWPHTQTWRDFSGGGTAGGDCFDYVMRREKATFWEALGILADKVGVQMPGKDNKGCTDLAERINQRRMVEKILTYAAGHFHAVLPPEIREEWYVKRYGFTDETIDSLKLGWGDGDLYPKLYNVKGATKNDILATGLVVETPTNVEDSFVNRLVFPYWKNGRVAYFIARKTDLTPKETWEEGKYKKLLTHSVKHPYVSTTLLNDTLYNEDAARGAEELLITEGVTDCISAMQVGIPCISPVTTSFSKNDHDKLLKLAKGCKRVVICNDSEKSGAGEAGALGTAHLLNRQRRDVRIATIPRPEGVDKIDVNELVSTQGGDALKEVIEQAKPLPLYLIEKIPEGTPKENLLELLKPTLNAMAYVDPLTQEACFEQLKKRFGLKASTVKPLIKEGSGIQKSASKHDKIPVQVNFADISEVLEPFREALFELNKARIERRANGEPRQKDEPPILFVRDGKLVALQDEPGVKLQLVPFDALKLRTLTTHDIYWHKLYIDKETGEEEEKDAAPHQDSLNQIVGTPPDDLPRIEGVVTTPFFNEKGELRLKRGCYPQERIWLEPNPVLKPEDIPEKPSAVDVANARTEFLENLFVDFPFATEADRAHMMSAVLAPFVRRMIDSPSPLYIMESPSPGSGKTTLCQLAGIISTGKDTPAKTLSENEDEIRKMITATLRDAPPYVLVDNADEKKLVNSVSLATVITTTEWVDRVLGVSENVEMPNRAVWMLTGNNPRMARDLARRALRVRVDPQCEMAWTRKDFKHENIKEWAKKHRKELVRSALVLVQAWIADGKPEGEKTIGSFESWCKVLGGILKVAGINGFLDNADEMYETSDPETDMWKEFVLAWWGKPGPALETTASLNDFCENKNLMLGVRGDGTTRSQQIRLGIALSGAKGRIFNGFRIYSEKSPANCRLYGLKNMNPPANVSVEEHDKGVDEPVRAGDQSLSTEATDNADPADIALWGDDRVFPTNSTSATSELPDY